MIKTFDPYRIIFLCINIDLYLSFKGLYFEEFHYIYNQTKKITQKQHNSKKTDRVLENSEMKS